MLTAFRPTRKLTIECGEFGSMDNSHAMRRCTSTVTHDKGRSSEKKKEKKKSAHGGHGVHGVILVKHGLKPQNAGRSGKL